MLIIMKNLKDSKIKVLFLITRGGKELLFSSVFDLFSVMSKFAILFSVRNFDMFRVFDDVISVVYDVYDDFIFDIILLLGVFFDV